jgi:hypothetical protein
VARLLILTRSTGDAQTSELRTPIIAGPTNQAAHNRLYRTILARAASFDFFLELDTD